MKIYNKFVESKKEPSNKNDIWFDGSSWKMYKEGVWRSFTLPIELAKNIEDAVKDLDLGNYLKKTDVDSALSETSINPVKNKVITERLNTLMKNLDSGTFPNLTAGDLAGRGESVPASFGFRASGGKSIKDGRAYIKRIKGNSVVWNQIMNIAPFWNIQYDDEAFSKSQVGMTYIISCNDFVSTEGGQAAHTFVLIQAIEFKQGHKYLIVADLKAKYVHNLKFGIYDGTDYRIIGVGGGSASQCSYIYEPTSTFVSDLLRFDAEVSIEDYGKAKTLELTPRIYDLTQMFQAGNEPSTIEEFNARVATLGIEDMYAYNEGQVIHCNTESIKSVGDNAWDEQWEVGGFSADGMPSSTANRIRSRNYIEVLANEEYYSNKYLTIFFYDDEMRFLSYIDMTKSTFTTPSGCRYIRFYLYGVEDYNHDICIRLAHSGYKTDYEPYWQDILPLPIISKYFPDGMKKASTAHDEIRFNKASGKWEYSKGRIKSVELSSIIKEETNKDGEFLLTLPTNYAAITSVADIPRLLCAPFITNTVANVNGGNLNDCIYGMDDWLIIRSSRHFTLSDIKAEMADVMLYYESNNWEWEELDAEDQNFRDYYNVADFGTEMSQSNNVPSAAFSADIIYQFNAVDMIREHEMEINELQSIIATMQAQLTSLINNQ